MGSLADQAVQVLSEVARIDEGVDLEHPDRHAIRELKRAAERAIHEGLNVAAAIAMSARTVRETVAELREGKAS